MKKKGYSKEEMKTESVLGQVNVAFSVNFFTVISKFFILRMDINEL